MDIREDSDEALVSLFVAFGYIDGQLDRTEVAVIREACEVHDLDPSLVDRFVEQHAHSDTDFSANCHAAATSIINDELREKAIAVLCDIAAADDMFRHNEKEFLSVLADTWGKAAIGKPVTHNWDKHQYEVIVAPHRERVEVHAGPGMGKTAVACARVSDLIDQGVEPTNIWLLSFTRTAVNEIRDRIAQFSEDATSVLGVKIGTIDSRAWRIRCGFTEGDVDKLFGSYDASIEDVITILDSDSHEMHEFLDSLEHVIIDEAQDITGLRARLIITLLNMLPSNCGVTIFADPTQAIYGFTTDNDTLTEEDRGDLLSLVRLESAKEFCQHELQTIHRTTAPNLVDLIEDLRLDIYINENIDKKQFRARRELIFKKAHKTLGEFSTDELRDIDNALVLFRRRSEVLLASAFACNDTIKHRIRMSGLPTVIHPWIGQILGTYEKPVLDLEGFIALWEASRESNRAQRLSHVAAWDILARLASRSGQIDLSVLRKKLARSVPDINACLPDLGATGPIIGTIHASKGREADKVILRLPPEGRVSTSDQLDEESRVMFVGASRAKSSLLVGNGFLRVAYASSLDNGRTFYRPNSAKGTQLPAALVEIGRKADVDPYSFVSKAAHSQESSMKIQESLSRRSNLAPCALELHANPSRSFRYEISTVFDGDEPGRVIGSMNESFNKDLWSVLGRIETRRSSSFRPPMSIKNVFLLGLSTFAASEDDPRLTDVHEPFSRSGFWLVPILIGFPKIVFQWRRRGGRKY